MPATARLAIALAVLLLAAGCGLRFFYTQLDWLVPWYVKDYITLDGDQRALLETRLLQRLDWHCRTQVPDYAQWLRRAEQRLVEGDLELADLEGHAEQAEVFWRELMAAIAPDAAEILAAADDAQVHELFANFEDRNRKVREEYLEPAQAERHAQRVERMERRLRRWFGPMNPGQRELIEAWSAELAPVAEDWLENRRRWQARLGAALERRAQRPEFDALIAELLGEPEAHWSEAYRARVEANRQRTLALLLDLYKFSTPRQQARLLREVRSLATDFERLACTAEPTAS